MVDTTDEWIRTRTGVERRHVVGENQTTSDLCLEAAPDGKVQVIKLYES